MDLPAWFRVVFGLSLLALILAAGWYTDGRRP